MRNAASLLVVATPVLLLGLGGVAAADSLARCDAVLLRATGSAVAGLMRCQTPDRDFTTCEENTEAALRRAAATARRSPCTTRLSDDALWARVLGVAAELSTGIGATPQDEAGCAAKRALVAADGVVRRVAAHTKVRKASAPERFAKAMLSSGAAIDRHLALTESAGCTGTVDTLTFAAEVDIATRALLEGVYDCEAIEAEEVMPLAAGKWRALLEHASGIGYATVTGGTSCPNRRAVEGGAPVLLSGATLASSTGETIDAVSYPGAGIATLVRDDQEATAAFSWLGGVKVAGVGRFEQVDSTGSPVAPGLTTTRARTAGLFDACKDAHDEATKCWVNACTHGLQESSACLQVVQCFLKPRRRWLSWVLLNALGCASSIQTLSTIPCPKLGQPLPCTVPGEDEECPVSGMCNILDVCRPERFPASNGDECSPEAATGGPKGPFCREDGRLQRNRCSQGSCVPAKPVRCAEGCCGAEGEARCWEGPGSCLALCGNRKVEPGEVCDDGNEDPDDGCNACQLSAGEHMWWVWTGPFNDDAFVAARAGGQPANESHLDAPPAPTMSVNQSAFSEMSPPGPTECPPHPGYFARVTTTLNASLSPFAGSISARVSLEKNWCGAASYGGHMSFANATRLFLYRRGPAGKKYRYTVTGQWDDEGSCQLYGEHTRSPFTQIFDVGEGGPLVCPDGVGGCGRVEIPTVPIWGDDGGSPAACSTVIQGTVSFSAERVD